MQTSYFIYAIIIVGVFTAYMALVNIFRRDRLRARVQSASVDNYYDDDGSPPPLFASFCNGILSVMGGVDPKLQKETSLLLYQAGIASPYGVSYYLCFKRIVQPIIFLLGLAVAAKLLFAGAPMPAMNKMFMLMVALILLVAGLYGAQLYSANRKQRRQKILLLSFPEAIDLILVCIESGLGLDAALNKICTEMRTTHPVIAAELDRTRIELTVMSDRSQAFQNLADRTGIIQFKSFASVLIQTEKFGTSLLDSLRVLSDDIRNTRLMNAETRAARIPVLITIPLIFCMLPAFIIIILGPPMVRVIEQGGIFSEKHTSRE